MEQDRLVKYKGDSPNFVYSLSQNPDVINMYSSEACVQCISRNCNLMWVGAQGRWLTPVELLCFQALFVHLDLHGGPADAPLGHNVCAASTCRGPGNDSTSATKLATP